MLPSDTEAQPQMTAAPIKNNLTASQKWSLKRRLEENSKRGYTKRQKMTILTKPTEVLNHTTGVNANLSENQLQMIQQTHSRQEPTTEALTVNGINDNAINAASTIPYASNLLIKTHQAYEERSNRKILSAPYGYLQTRHFDLHSHEVNLERPSVNDVTQRRPNFAEYGRKIESIATRSRNEILQAKCRPKNITPAKRDSSNSSIQSSKISRDASIDLFTVETPSVYQDLNEREIHAVRSDTFNMPPDYDTIRQIRGQDSMNPGPVIEKQSMTNVYYSQQQTYPQRPTGIHGKVNYHGIYSQSTPRMPSAQSIPYQLLSTQVQVSERLNGKPTSSYQPSPFQKPLVQENIAGSSAAVNYMYQRNHIDVRTTSEHLLKTPYTTSSYSNYGQPIQFPQAAPIPSAPSYTDWLLQNIYPREVPGRPTEINPMTKKCELDYRVCSQSITKKSAEPNSTILDQSAPSSQYFKPPTFYQDYALQDVSLQSTNTSTVSRNSCTLPNHFYQSSEGCLPITIEYFPPDTNTGCTPSTVTHSSSIVTNHGKIISDQGESSFKEPHEQEVTDINLKPISQSQHSAPTCYQTITQCTQCEIKNNINGNQNINSQETVIEPTIAAESVSTEGNTENASPCQETKSHVNQSSSWRKERFPPSIQLSSNKEKINETIATEENSDDSNKSSNEPSTSRSIQNSPKINNNIPNTRAKAEKVIMKNMRNIFKKMYALTDKTNEMIEEDKHLHIQTIDILRSLMKRIHRSD